VYWTRNNRLMHYEVFDVADAESPVLLERVDYYYLDGAVAAGNVTHVIRQVVGDPNKYCTDLVYNKRGEVWFVVNRSWDTYCDLQQIDRIVEFQGGGRGRMMVRQRDPNDRDFVLPGTTRWTLDTPRTLRVQTRPCRAVRQGQADYDGDAPYGDFSVSFPGGTPQVDEQTAYLPGIGQIDATTGQATYVYADHLGTARAAMVPGDEAPRHRFYTAFGEPVDSSGTGVPPVSVTDFCEAGASPPFCPRYQYVGAHGYETGLVPDDGNYASANWQHVGHRWYDPNAGRFMQRDPIGIRAGLNTYAYVSNSPVRAIDPHGLDEYTGIDWIARNVWMNIHSTETLANMSDGRMYAEAIGGSVALGASGYAAYWAVGWAAHGGWVQVGTTGSSFLFRASPSAPWLYGLKGHIMEANFSPTYTMWLRVRYPEVIPTGEVWGGGASNCLFTLLQQLWRAG